ncbi:hypothetical protein ACI3EY_16770 [Ornithinimicrobium sp. LYQ92]|uniref:hypothetical protein n=1 Tax=Serinicoccus sp. LYQ92 TaxID=3378798 RepID=UPI003852EBEA
MSESCDYCYTSESDAFYLRAIGFTEYDGYRSPLVKAWCGNCEPDEPTDPEATAAMWKAVKAQRRGAS